MPYLNPFLFHSVSLPGKLWISMCFYFWFGEVMCFGTHRFQVLIHRVGNFQICFPQSLACCLQGCSIASLNRCFTFWCIKIDQYLLLWFLCLYEGCKEFFFLSSLIVLSIKSRALCISDEIAVLNPTHPLLPSFAFLGAWSHRGWPELTQCLDWPWFSPCLSLLR